MNDARRCVALSVEEVAEVRQQARKKLIDLNKQNDIIGTQVFALLGLSARVLYYPLDEDGPWGFTCLGEGKPFVAINTAITAEKQVFAAAHELYHISFDTKADYIPPTVLREIDEKGEVLDSAELKANRFAAEFLIDEGLLKQEMCTYGIMSGKTAEKDILMLAALFSVPYETMVKRLHEIKAISSKDREVFLNKTTEELRSLQRRYSFPIAEADGRIVLDTLVELAVKQYEHNKITFEKLSFLLHMGNLKPEDVGITRPPVYIRPSDEELDSIMEE